MPKQMRLNYSQFEKWEKTCSFLPVALNQAFSARIWNRLCYARITTNPQNLSPKNHQKSKSLVFPLPLVYFPTAVTIRQWTGLLDSRKLPLEEKGTAMRGPKTPDHKTCSSAVVAHLNVASFSVVPSHPACFGWEPGCGYISTPPTSAHAHYELRVESVRV